MPGSERRSIWKGNDVCGFTADPSKPGRWRLRRQGDQQEMEQATERLPVERRGWLADEQGLHQDKPSFTRHSTDDGGG